MSKLLCVGDVDVLVQKSTGSNVATTLHEQVGVAAGLAGAG
ncbi:MULTISPECIES: hypothetical protein [Arthrobacter]|nr:MULTISPECIES: hypothetical protein [Arthrobacter]